MINSKGRAQLLGRLTLLIAICVTFTVSMFSQTNTPSGTVISNQAAATYSDGLQTYNAVSNTVTVTVAEIAGLSITPDAGTTTSVVPGQASADFFFTVNNTGNAANQIRFLANGASMRLVGPGAITAAVIDADGSNTINAGDVNIFTNGSDVISSTILQGGSVKVLVRASINANATGGQSVQVILGDASGGAPTYDNQTADSSPNEVRTVNATAVNGLREARGDVTATVDTDAQLLVTLTAPAGPIQVGANVSYSTRGKNVGLRAAFATTLINAPVGSNSGIFIIAPIPVQTTLASGQTFPTGTLFTISPLSTSPLLAVWTTTPPSDLSTVTRIAFNAGSTLAVNATSSDYSFQVKINSNANASTPISEIVDIFGTNSIGTVITDQSGDNVANMGDGNANFDEGDQPGNVDGNGVAQVTTLGGSGSVLNGPLLRPDAVGPNSTNDDYTNLSTNQGIFVPFGGTTTVQDRVVFSNTVKNTGSLNDVFVLTAPTVPAGFTVEISTNAGLSFTNVTSGGSASITVLFNLTGTYLVRITAPQGTPVVTGYDTVIRATSTATPGNFNDTIDRVYTGFIRLDKTATVANNTGVGGATDPVPGAIITYTITYTNISSGGGTNNTPLIATGIVINENGNLGSNNWATTTNMVLGSASDTRQGGGVSVITGADILTADFIIDTVTLMALQPGQHGTFTFQRVIK